MYVRFVHICYNVIKDLNLFTSTSVSIKMYNTHRQEVDERHIHRQEVGHNGETTDDVNYFLLNNTRHVVKDCVGSPRIKRNKQDDNVYNFYHSKRGIALIINNDTFDDETLPYRTGAEKDSIKLESCFTKLGFDVRLGVNLTKFETLQYIKMVANEMDRNRDFDCFVLAVSSHGSQEDVRGNQIILDVIHCTDGYIPTKQLLEILSDENCPGLKDKPRLCFLQACRGSKLDDGVTLNDLAAVEVVDSVRSVYPSDNVNTSPFPCMKDFLVVYSTPPGYYAFRRLKEGSWFVVALTKVFGSIVEGQCDLNKLLRQVVKEVAYSYQSKSTTAQYDSKKQAPCIYSMLTKLVYLSPK